MMHTKDNQKLLGHTHLVTDEDRSLAALKQIRK
jgi:hypothetical protein